MYDINHVAWELQDVDSLPRKKHPLLEQLMKDVKEFWENWEPILPAAVL